MSYFAALALAAGFGFALAVAAAATGQGRAAAQALDGMARQPEMAGRLQTAMILGLAFIESLVLFTLLTFFTLSGKLPETTTVLEVIKQVGIPK